MIFKSKNLTALEDAQEKANLSNDWCQSLGSIDQELEKINSRNEIFTQSFIDEQQNILAVFEKYGTTLTDELYLIVQKYLENQAEKMNEFLDIYENGIAFRSKLQKEMEAVQQKTEHLIKNLKKIAK
ncbi:MAG: hypothetical protein IMY72_09345 [Bacteroidetes bacterium]|nr:hypothetical protein [Bacteroidota bacterium]